VSHHRRFAAIGVGQHLLVEVYFARFGDVGRDGVEEPERVVAAKLLFRRRFFVSRPMRKRLHERHGAAAFDLAREHQLESVAHLLFEQRRDAQEILHGIAIAEAVALPVVDQRRGARPSIRDERVVRVPHVDHRVELVIGRLSPSRPRAASARTASAPRAPVRSARACRNSATAALPCVVGVPRPSSTMSSRVSPGASSRSTCCTPTMFSPSDLKPVSCPVLSASGSL